MAVKSLKKLISVWKGWLLLPLFVFSNLGFSESLSQRDFRKYIHYYAEKEMWVPALSLSTDLMTTPSLQVEDYRVHTKLLWEVYSNSKKLGRDMVNKFLQEKKYSINRRAWKKIWNQNQAQVYFKKSIQNVEIARADLAKKNCKSARKRLKSIPAPDKKSRGYKEVYLTFLYQCQESRTFSAFWLDSIVADPFWPFHQQLIAKLIEKNDHGYDFHLKRRMTWTMRRLSKQWGLIKPVRMVASLKELTDHFEKNVSLPADEATDSSTLQ